MGADNGKARLMSVVDEAALEELFQQYDPQLLRMLQGRLGPKLAVRVSAEDLLQEVHKTAWKKWRWFETSGMEPYPWLYRIARDHLFEARQHWNRECRNLNKEMPWPDRSSEQIAMGLVDSVTSPSEALTRGEKQERVRQALDRLPPKDREIVWMRHFDDLSYQEVAAVLDISVDAAMQRYRRALQRLEDLLWDLVDRGGSEP
jgi:RNA polymerase sigma-70 factor (ECF subfamily)